MHALQWVHPSAARLTPDLRSEVSLDDLSETRGGDSGANEPGGREADGIAPFLSASMLEAHAWRRSSHRTFDGFAGGGSGNSLHGGGSSGSLRGRSPSPQHSYFSSGVAAAPAGATRLKRVASAVSQTESEGWDW